MKLKLVKLSFYDKPLLYDNIVSRYTFSYKLLIFFFHWPPLPFFCQILGSDIPSDDSAVPSNIRPADVGFGEETVESANEGDQYFDFESNQHADENMYDMPTPYDIDIRAVKHEYIGESSKSVNFEELDFLLDEPVMDSFNDLPYGNGGFIEANDLSNPVETKPSTFDMLNDYLYYDANDNTTQLYTYDPSGMLGSEDDLISNQPLIPTEVMLSLKLPVVLFLSLL